jgi:hypothetical protein
VQNNNLIDFTGSGGFSNCGLFTYTSTKISLQFYLDATSTYILGIRSYDPSKRWLTYCGYSGALTTHYNFTVSSVTTVNAKVQSQQMLTMLQLSTSSSTLANAATGLAGNLITVSVPQNLTGVSFAGFRWIKGAQPLVS